MSVSGARPRRSGGREHDLEDAPRIHAEQSAADLDQSAADLDQTQSDRDQTAADGDRGASGEDQAASDADQLSSARDQRAADRDQAAADIEGADDPPGGEAEGARDASRAERAAGTRERSSTTRARAHIAAQRDETARARDLSALARDRAADARDRIAGARDRITEARAADLTASGHAGARLEQAVSVLTGLRLSGARLRARAADDRAAAAANRVRAAEDRRHSAIDRRHAGRDELTGVFRREAGELALEHEIDRARRSARPLVLAMIDVDELKTVNDREGHAAGDALLRDIAQVITSTLRSYDVLVRWGGDEFVCALSDMTLEAAPRPFEEVRSALRKRRPSASISVGLTQLTDADVLGSLVARADATLYREKANPDRHLTRARADRATEITDPLTGLGNRRAFNRDLEQILPSVSPGHELIVAMFDLDGMRHYNDTFGHAAGDALLVRLSGCLRDATGSQAKCYRMGGDEFCLLAQLHTEAGEQLVRAACAALSDSGEDWQVACAWGMARIPSEATGASDALSIADQRMYAQKASRASASNQTAAALVQVLAERDADLGSHITHVAELAIVTAQPLGVPEHEITRIGLAAQLHDIGKTATPERTLAKPGPLDDAEWAFMRRHTIIGERIVAAAPSLAHTASLVRSTHERPDGTGYPDSLTGTDIPLGSRIIAVCDAYDAMTATRPYREPRSTPDAITELRHCAGTQFGRLCCFRGLVRGGIRRERGDRGRLARALMRIGRPRLRTPLEPSPGPT